MNELMSVMYILRLLKIIEPNFLKLRDYFILYKQMHNSEYRQY